MPTYLNLVIPCGISLLTNLRYDREAPTGWENFLEKLNTEPLEQERVALAPDDEVAAQNELVRLIGEAKTGTKPTRLLGSELSTLEALRNRAGNRAWKPNRDFITLLRTETFAGKFATDVIHKALVTHWYVPHDENHLCIKVISGWKPNLSMNQAETALGYLADNINTSLRKSDERTGNTIHNILVATGGMRSTLPCLTIYSLLYGFELVCITEESTYLLELRPAQEGGEHAIDWSAVFRSRRGTGGSMLQAYIRKALEYHKRAKNQKDRYF